MILDGSQALRKAVRAIFGEAALIQRCQVHKIRNILDYLQRPRSPVGAGDPAARLSGHRREDGAAVARSISPRLETEYPSAAESVREGLDETLTVLTLKLSPRLRRSLATTNAAESLLSRTRHVKRNVKRWRGGQMMLRWVAAGVLEAVKGFRRLKGYADMPTLVNALRARDRQLGSSLQKGIVRSRSRHPSRRRISTADGTSPDAVSMGIASGAVAAVLVWKARIEREVNRRLWSSLKAIARDWGSAIARHWGSN